ncbi:MAG: hypothetical protein AAFQ55_11885, partial [Pseudomonadota bacterium]
MIRTVIIAAALIGPGLAVAQGLEVQPVTEGVWAIVGEKEQRSPENLGNNATFGVVMTGDGAVLIDPGWSVTVRMAACRASAPFHDPPG